MAYSASSNRGMSGFPSEYLQNWGSYNPFPQGSGGGLTGKAARNANAAENAAYANGGGGFDLLSMFGLGGGGAKGPTSGGQVKQIPYMRRPRGGRGAPGTVFQQPGQGGSGGSLPIPTPTPTPTPTPQPAPAPPPSAGMAANIQQILASYTNPITNGQLSNEAIQQAMATLNGGAPAWATQQFGGAFGQNLNQEIGRAGINLQRGAAEQQAAMDLAYQRARAGAGLDMAGLLQQANSQNVMHGLNMQGGQLSAILNLLGGVL